MKNNMKFDFDDILIQPAMLSDIESRGNIIITDEKGYLPIFTAPMDTVVDLNNYKIFLDNGIRVILPRTILEKTLPYDENSEYLWFSYGLKDVENLFLSNNSDRSDFVQNHLKNNKLYILIDIANGNMIKLHDTIKKLKDKYGDMLEIMAGNIANPETYKILSELGIYGVRCTIGNGCFTSDMKIITINGLEKIKDVKIGDYVKTHKNRYKKVLKKYEYYKNENILIINDKIECTKNHEFYVINKTDKDRVNDTNYINFAFWLPANKLDKNKHLLIKNMELIEIEKIEEKNYEGYVYDLKVEEDCSYNIDDVIVHNSGCLTTEKLGVGYPSASLIKECYDISCTLKNPAKIIMDGGLKEVRDFIKSYALGSDFCMCGGVFNKALESCADTYTQNVKHDWGTEPGELVDQYSETTKLMLKNGSKFFKKFRGMSTKEVQKSLGNEILKTSEGITRMNQVEYTIEGWCDNFKHYLASAMSYTNKISLKNFIGQVEYNLITENAFKRYNK